jgi:hypothetical protein
MGACQLLPLGALVLQLFNNTLQFVSKPRNGKFKTAFHLPALGKCNLELFSGGIGGKPGLFQSLFGILAPKTFSLQLLVNRFELCLLGNELRLYLFKSSFSGESDLFQSFFRLFVLVTFNLQLFDYRLKLPRTLGSSRFQSEFDLIPLVTLSLQLLFEPCQFLRTLDNGLFQVDFRLPALGKVTLKLLGDRFSS